MRLMRNQPLRNWVHALPIVIGFVLAAGLSGPLNAGEPGAGVIGKWKFSSVLDATEITAMSSTKAHQLVGKVMTIDKTKVELEGYTCLPPEFETERVEPNLYLRKQGHTSAANLGLPNPVTVVDIGCGVVFIKNPNRLVISWDGFFFDAVRVRR